MYSSSSSSSEVEVEEPEINATVIENNANIILNLTQQNELTSLNKKLLNSKINSNNKSISEIITLRNIDTNKIQSNTKDIVDDGEHNIVMTSGHRKIIITATSTPILRSTLPNIFSNSGGNGSNLDNVQLLSLEGSNRKRHRNRRQGKNKHTVASQEAKEKEAYEARVARLRHELTRPSESPTEKHFAKPKSTERRRHNKKKFSTSKPLIDVMAPSYEQDATVDSSSSIHHRVTRAATAKKDRIWDYGVIPYEIDANFSGGHKALFKQGELMNEILIISIIILLI